MLRVNGRTSRWTAGNELIRDATCGCFLTRSPPTAADDALGFPMEAPPAYLRDAVRFIRARLSEPLSVDEIANAAGVSRRTLQSAFRKHYGSGVMDLARQCRLERAHEHLLAADAQAVTVTAVALESGFSHLSRFSSYYRQRFAENPCETLHRQRSAGCQSRARRKRTAQAAQKPRAGSGWPRTRDQGPLADQEKLVG